MNHDCGQRCAGSTRCETRIARGCGNGMPGDRALGGSAGLGERSVVASDVPDTRA